MMTLHTRCGQCLEASAMNAFDAQKNSAAALSRDSMNSSGAMGNPAPYLD
jgi:hypothetical protein